MAKVHMETDDLYQKEAARSAHQFALDLSCQSPEFIRKMASALYEQFNDQQRLELDDNREGTDLSNIPDMYIRTWECIAVRALQFLKLA